MPRGARLDRTADLFSIGDVAEATGIAPDTIRVWERRYGRPRPVRLPSGHRRYTGEQVRWLRRVASALALGNRPSRAVRASEDELSTMLAAAGEAPDEAVLARLVEAVRAYRESALTEQLWKAWREQGPMRCTASTVAPLLGAVGRAWAEGRLDIRHEHFLSEVVAHFLRAARLTLPVKTEGPAVALATLPGEQHVLGLHMAAIACVLGGGRPRLLGADVPPAEIARAVREMAADGVGLSVSLATGGVESDRMLADLRGLLPESVRIAVGGRGARGVRRGPRGLDYPEDLQAFAGWVASLAGASQG